MNRGSRAVAYGAFVVLLCACGSGESSSGGGTSGGGNGASGKELSGAYLPQGEGIYDRLEFLPDRKVSVTFGVLQPRVLEYAVMPDGRVKVFGDKVQTLRALDDGCLVLRGAGEDGIEIDLPDFGRYCLE